MSCFPRSLTHLPFIFFVPPAQVHQIYNVGVRSSFMSTNVKDRLKTKQDNILKILKEFDTNFWKNITCVLNEQQSFYKFYCRTLPTFLSVLSRRPRSDISLFSALPKILWDFFLCISILSLPLSVWSKPGWNNWSSMLLFWFALILLEVGVGLFIRRWPSWTGCLFLRSASDSWWKIVEKCKFNMRLLELLLLDT